jgi:hypothetical protein
MPRMRLRTDMGSVPMKRQKRLIVAGPLVTRPMRSTGSWRPHHRPRSPVAAVLQFANEHEDAGGEWPYTDAIGPDGWHYQLRATMAAAIEALIKVPAGRAVQS